MKTFVQALKNQYNCRRRKPLTIQMPITSRCNSRCKTCNVWTLHSTDNIDPIALKKAFEDSFFSEVLSVGLNGGEFTLVPNFIEILQSVLTLPKIKSVYLISNGLFPSRLLSYLSQAHSICVERNVHLSFCLSVDGFGSMHDLVRGIPGGFIKTQSILDEMKLNYKNYCDTFSIGCTLSRYNISSICETQNFLEQYPFPVEYHLAVPNKRIGTFDKASYYVLTEEKSRLLAAEFFLSKFKSETNERKRVQYFTNYYFLTHNGFGRLNQCGYLRRDITIDENLNACLCATASDSIGSLVEQSASNIYYSKSCKEEEKKVSSYCNNCAHYTYYPLSFHGRILYIRALMQKEFSMCYYKVHPIKWNKKGLRAVLAYNYHYYSRLARYIYRFFWLCRV